MTLRSLVCAAIWVAALTTSLSGCIVAPTPVYATGPVVTIAPPAPRVEVYGAPPVVGHVWIGGHWDWHGNAHVWVPGRWQAPPRPGYYWRPHSWVQGRGGWRQHGGHWDR